MNILKGSNPALLADFGNPTQNPERLRCRIRTEITQNTLYKQRILNFQGASWTRYILNCPYLLYE